MSPDIPFLDNWELDKVQKEIENFTGKGTIYITSHYKIKYEPNRSTFNLKCNGIKIYIVDSKENTTRVIHTEYIYFKPGLLFNKEPFSERLKTKIIYMKESVNRYEKQIADRNKREKDKSESIIKRQQDIKVHAEKIKACQLRIDNTIKSIAPEAKSDIEIITENQRIDTAKIMYESMYHTDKINFDQMKEENRNLSLQTKTTNKAQERSIAAVDQIYREEKNLPSEPEKDISLMEQRGCYHPVRTDAMSELEKENKKRIIYKSS